MSEIDEFQHPDSIWTWKSNKRGGKTTLWLPYVSRVERVKKSAWRFTYNGGEVDADVARLDCVMFYGTSGQIPVALVDELATLRVPLLVHRRNVGRPAVFLPAPGTDAGDMLTKQIVARTHSPKRAYIARTLVRERFRGVADTFPLPDTAYRRLARTRTLGQIRLWEAEHSRKYWRKYFAGLGHPDVTRREKGSLPAALDAGSMFLSGILLRWLLIHRLSPSHGFLHEGTDYMGLIYDLMEPARYMIEEAVAAACQRHSPGSDADSLTQATLSGLKHGLEKVVYVPATRQSVRRKNLLHGTVLALRAYLAGDMCRFVIPAAGTRKGGRPPKVSYRLPGDIPAR